MTARGRSIEVELKLALAPQDVSRLRSDPLLAIPPTARGSTVHNVYFDTADLALKQRSAALRLRHIGRRWLQTLKHGGAGALSSRAEWEMQVAGPALELHRFSAPPAQQLLAELGAGLDGKFVCRFQRITRRLRWDGSDIEFALDVGEIRAGDTRVPICEVEMELIAGDAGSLFTLARRLSRNVILLPEPRSKATRGYSLAAGAALKPVKASKPALADDAPSAMLSIVESCVAQWRANELGVAASDDIEYVHQMRVALRRLRAALRLCARLPELPPSRALAMRLRSVARRLGELRDLDVFFADSVPALVVRLPAGLNCDTAFDTLEHRRRRKRKQMAPYLNAKAYAGCVLGMVTWCWRAANVAPVGPSTRGFAVRMLARRHRSFWQLAQQIDSLDAGGRHQLRIEGKKLRYAAEFFAAQFDHEKAAPYLATLEKLQEILGEQNDNVNALSQINTLPPHSGECVAFARGFWAGKVENWQAPLAQCLAELAQQEKFWKR